MSRCTTPERAICDELLPNYYGDVLLQAGIPSVPIYQKSATRRQIMMGVSAGELIGNPGQLPFANESIDVLVAQHLLDVGARPQFLVQELARTILPMGRLIVIGFNPLSLWSCRRVLAAKRKGHQAQWGLAPRRLLDWLNLLNFKIDRIEFGGFGWPGQALGRRRPDFSRTWTQIQYGVGRYIRRSRAAIQRCDFSPTSEDAQSKTIQAHRCRSHEFDAFRQAETD